MRSDVIVAGAGPARSLASYVLAKSGRDVLLVDGAVRDRRSLGEALPGAACRLLQSEGVFVLSATGPHLKIDGNLSSWASDQLAAVDFIRDPDGPGWRLDRLKFDFDLKEAARSIGVRVIENRIAHVTRRFRYWRVRLQDDTEATCRWLIDATGRDAAVALRLGVSRRKDDSLTAVWAVGAIGEGRPFNRTLIEATPIGWWYAACLPDNGAMSILHTSPADASRLVSRPAEWSKALASTQYVSQAFCGVRFENRPRGVAASGGELDRFCGAGWMACGDAALSFDPLAGQGLFNAVSTGIGAARAIIECGNGDGHSLNRYSRKLKTVRQTYLSRRRSFYLQEQRWPNSPFWKDCRAAVLKDIAKMDQKI